MTYCVFKNTHWYMSSCPSIRIRIIVEVTRFIPDYTTMDALYEDIFGSEEMGSDSTVCSVGTVSCDQCENSDTPCEKCESKWLLHASQCDKCKLLKKPARKSRLELLCSNKSAARTRSKPPSLRGVAEERAPKVGTQADGIRQTNEVSQGWHREWQDWKNREEAERWRRLERLERRERRREEEEMAARRRQDPTEILEPSRPVLTDLPPRNFVHIVLMRKRDTGMALPYLKHNGITWIVYTLSYLRGTAHAVGVWANCEPPPPTLDEIMELVLSMGSGGFDWARCWVLLSYRRGGKEPWVSTRRTWVGS
ncbi:uncharacterized protein F4822DRAFT_413953 [Hypoxylon trugodes]|uniref:uncharacterized protein n=1 Tax=Hypoxylon trugodes TaxID=326681 RepID=UPI002192F39A|nr:uncharacterized protein F4822DRAFT_413953 [Hypoxylon trugodes]KAI1385710.1 hypothetical protein F4822DRAFT_413953 [Hypoxylon trugodes]